MRHKKPQERSNPKMHPYKEVQRLITRTQNENEQQARESLKKAKRILELHRDSGAITEHDADILKNKLKQATQKSQERSNPK